MENLISKIYTGLDDSLPPTLNTTEVGLSNQDIVKGYSGLESTEGIKMMVVSEPMIGSQAYSLVMVQAENSKNINKTAIFFIYTPVLL